jgi:hypothetical protein
MNAMRPITCPQPVTFPCPTVFPRPTTPLIALPPAVLGTPWLAPRREVERTVRARHNHLLEQFAAAAIVVCVFVHCAYCAISIITF